MGGDYVQGHDTNNGAYAAVGIASYHFENANEVYIHYCTVPSSWRFDNGNSIPARKDFTQMSFDPDTRTFTGMIDWMLPGRSGAEPSTWQGAAQWSYTMVFTEDYSQIRSGAIEIINAQHQVVRRQLYGAWHYNRVANGESTCGDQALGDPGEFLAIGRVFVSSENDGTYSSVGAQSFHFENVNWAFVHNCPADSDAPITLDNGNVAPEILNFTALEYNMHSRVFEGTVDWGALGSTVRGASTWVYSLGFADGYARIETGHYTPRNVEGRALPGQLVRFEYPEYGFHYARVDEADEESSCMATASPTAAPSGSPTTSVPTPGPTVAPTTPGPTPEPTVVPSSSPTASPSISPTSSVPTTAPSSLPTSAAPTVSPSSSPTSAVPTASPSISPTVVVPPSITGAGDDPSLAGADASTGSEDDAAVGSGALIVVVLVAVALLMAVMIGAYLYVKNKKVTNAPRAEGFDNPMYTDTGVAAGAVVYAEVGDGADGNKSGYMDIPGATANGGGNRTAFNAMYAQTSQTSGYVDVAPMDDGMEEDV